MRQLQQNMSMEDLSVGCVVWLHPKSPENKSIKCICEKCIARVELNNKAYNHPVLVVRKRQKVDLQGQTETIYDVVIVSPAACLPHKSI